MKRKVKLKFFLKLAASIAMFEGAVSPSFAFAFLFTTDDPRWDFWKNLLLTESISLNLFAVVQFALLCVFSYELYRYWTRK